MSYRLTVTVLGVKVRDEIREGTPKLDIAGFLREMKKLGIKTEASVNTTPQLSPPDRRQR